MQICSGYESGDGAFPVDSHCTLLLSSMCTVVEMIDTVVLSPLVQLDHS